MIHQIKSDFDKHVEELAQSDEIDGNLNGNVYAGISTHLIEILDMGATMAMRVHLEGIIDESSRMRDYITSRRMI